LYIFWYHMNKLALLRCRKISSHKDCVVKRDWGWEMVDLWDELIACKPFMSLVQDRASSSSAISALWLSHITLPCALFHLSFLAKKKKKVFFFSLAIPANQLDTKFFFFLFFFYSFSLWSFVVMTTRNCELFSMDREEKMSVYKCLLFFLHFIYV
jgi:hypothetical protein